MMARASNWMQPRGGRGGLTSYVTGAVGGKKSFSMFGRERKHFTSDRFGASERSASVRRSHLLAATGSRLIKTLHEHTKEVILKSQSLIKQTCLRLDLCPTDTNNTLKWRSGN